MNRRHWLRLARACLFGAAGVQAVAGSPQNPPKGETALSPTAEAELKAARERLSKADIGPLGTARSTHFQAIGDASEWFMSVRLRDCEQIMSEYLRHFRARGFQLRMPGSPLIVIVFRNDESFDKFFHLPSRRKAAKGDVYSNGIYDRATNALHVFDWRGAFPHSGRLIAQTLDHELTHQLSFNTGLLNREGDTPLCISEGLGTYGEARDTIGSGDFGRCNWMRLSDLTTCLRRLPWIPMRDLFSDDAILRTGKGDWVLLAYGESWLLVYYFLKDQALLPRFREYVKAIQPRSSADHRIDDAQTHLGDLDQLDRVLQQYAVRLERPH
jgi:hypothetical protein